MFVKKMAVQSHYQASETYFITDLWLKKVRCFLTNTTDKSNLEKLEVTAAVNVTHAFIILQIQIETRFQLWYSEEERENTHPVATTA